MFPHHTRLIKYLRIDLVSEEKKKQGYMIVSGV